MKKVFLIMLAMLAMLAMATTAANAAEEKKQVEDFLLEERVEPNLEVQTPLPSPPSGYMWIVTTCAAYLVPTSMFQSTEALLAYVAILQTWCDQYGINPK